MVYRPSTAETIEKSSKKKGRILLENGQSSRIDSRELYDKEYSKYNVRVIGTPQTIKEKTGKDLKICGRISKPIVESRV